LTSIVPSTIYPTISQTSIPSSQLISNLLSYIIALRNGISDGVNSDLKKAMDGLAYNILTEFDMDARVRSEIISQQDIGMLQHIFCSFSF
jgi:hypothetical protein